MVLAQGGGEGLSSSDHTQFTIFGGKMVSMSCQLMGDASVRSGALGRMLIKTDALDYETRNCLRRKIGGDLESGEIICKSICK